MQAGPRQTGQPSSVKIYNAVYSSVQVYECMVRGIAVMRRRNDSYVNATQILKVAGVDKGRRTKILEKEILPGKHEIVQGGYGKYQGTWIPLERGREVALQYGIAHLLSPLFDFIPSSSGSGGLPNSLPGLPGMSRPLSAASSLPPAGSHGAYATHQLGPAPIMPGSALRLLNQGRAQGLFTPSTSGLLARGTNNAPGAGGYYAGVAATGYPSPGIPSPAPSPSPGGPSLKRTRTDSELFTNTATNGGFSHSRQFASAPSTQMPGILAASPDIIMTGSTRPPSVASSSGMEVDGEGKPSPTKRARTVPPQSHLNLQMSGTNMSLDSQTQNSMTSQTLTNGSSHQSKSSLTFGGSRPMNGANATEPSTSIRLATTPLLPRAADRITPLKSAQRNAVMAAVCKEDNPMAVLQLIKNVAAAEAPQNRPPGPPPQVDIDMIIDDMGHTALHLAASLARVKTVEALVSHGADLHRGNYQGETPLIRATLSTHNFDSQSFHVLLKTLHPSVRTIDTAKRSVLHHITASAGVKGRAPFARYYLEAVLQWIAECESAAFRNLVDIQDEHGDTALNIAARVGNRSLVRSLIDVGANRILGNKLGLRPGDFGVEPEELGDAPRAEDLLSSLRSGPSVPAQKSQDVIADLTKMVSNLSSEFAVEIKAKQDAFDVTQAHLRAATRELADQRKQIQAWRSKCSDLDQLTQRVRNLEKALADEDDFDWTGRSELNGDPAGAAAGPSFVFRGPQSTMAGLGGSLDISFDLENEAPVPASDTLGSLVKMRRMKVWQDRMDGLMEKRLGALKGASADKEFQCKKIVALSANVPIDKVDEMLDDLIVAVESEPQMVDIGRVSSFLQKVREGVI